jgi:hypothetical protein
MRGREVERWSCTGKRENCTGKIFGWSAESRKGALFSALSATLQER